MKQTIVMGILAAMFMTILTACGNSAQSNQSQDVTSDVMDAEYEEEAALPAPRTSSPSFSREP